CSPNTRKFGMAPALFDTTARRSCRTIRGSRQPPSTDGRRAQAEGQGVH
ncbi:MAG: hypothetical protein AVDCRST_MAG59-1341, partial [uncultured Thermomicrobiales bacterium]